MKTHAWKVVEERAHQYWSPFAYTIEMIQYPPHQLITSKTARGLFCFETREKARNLIKESIKTGSNRCYKIFKVLVNPNDLIPIEDVNIPFYPDGTRTYKNLVMTSIKG